MNEPIIRFPGHTARSVRWAFWEPETKDPIRGSRFRDAIGNLKAAVRQTKQNKRAEQPLNIAQRANGPEFSSLPYDVKAVIFEMVHSLPSWVHFRFRNEQLVDVNGGSLEIYVNREWREDPGLRQDMSRSDPYGEETWGVGALARRVLGILVASEDGLRSLQERSNWGNAPFFVEVKRAVKTPLVKRRIDWFFFDGSLDVSPDNLMSRRLPEIRTFVFRLDDMYEAICSRRDNRSRSGLPPDFVFYKRSKAEELIILVGEFRRDIPPSDLKEVAAYHVDNLAQEDYEEGRQYGHEISNSEVFMITQITRELKKFLTESCEEWRTWLGGASGRTALAYPVHDNDNLISKWLASPDGNNWIEAGGFRFLLSESGWWWLASEFGYPWLESPQGKRWLGSQNAQPFLNSRQALLWANMPLENPTRKAWFNSVPGRQWEYDHRSDGSLSRPPQPPRRRSLPPFNVRIPSCMVNPNFQGWRFVMCPRETTGEGSSRLARGRRELGMTITNVEWV